MLHLNAFAFPSHSRSAVPWGRTRPCTSIHPQLPKLPDHRLRCGSNACDVQPSHGAKLSCWTLSGFYQLSDVSLRAITFPQLVQLCWSVWHAGSNMVCIIVWVIIIIHIASLALVLYLGDMILRLACVVFTVFPHTLCTFVKFNVFWTAHRIC